MLATRINKERLFIFSKRKLAYLCLYTAVIIAYLGSLNPWFMWSIGALYPIPACMMILVAFYLSWNRDNFLFRNRHLWATIAYLLVSTYIVFAERGNIKSLIVNGFHILFFFFVFRLSFADLRKTCDALSRFMGIILCISLFGFALYLIGFPLQGRNAMFGDGVYTFTNYFFFLLDDRSLFSIVPRFNAYFLEPGHLGSATVLLLATQIGKWNRWYNKVLIVTTLLTFSLAAYVYFVVLIFLKLWLQGKHFIKHAIAVIIAIAAIVGGSFVYRGGDNMIHTLIVLRMEISDEGKLAGNNRTTGTFDEEYASYLDSSDILIGRGDEEIPVGNSGFKVFIYREGLIGLALVIAFYLISFYPSKEKKSVFAALLIAVMAFVVRGYPLWDSNFIPLYELAFADTFLFSSESKKGLTSNIVRRLAQFLTIKADRNG